MNGSFKKFMKTGTIHFMSYPACMGGEGPILESLKKIAQDDYFDAVEVTWIKDPGIRRQAISLIDASGLTVCYAAQPRLLSAGLNINDLDAGKRRQALSSLKEGIDEACEWNAEGFAFLSGVYREETKEQSYQMPSGLHPGAVRIRRRKGKYAHRTRSVRLRCG